MTEKERKAINDYILEVFNYEHDLSTVIYTRLMLLAELLIKKGLITEEEMMDALSEKNVAEMMNEVMSDDNN